jgi:hypothetical protein
MSDENKPIFVVGIPRSGTTLVSRLLGRHPQVLAAGETHYFEDIWARRRELGLLADQSELSKAAGRLLTVFGRFNQPGQALVDRVLNERLIIERALDNGGGYDGTYLAFTDLLAESQGKQRYCDDTPKHLFYLETIFSFFPQAKVIACVRDPRDFLCSYKNFWRRSKDPDRIKALYHPIVTSMLWRSSAKRMLHSPFVNQAEKLLQIRYETLVEEPERQMRRMCDFVDLDYDESLLRIDSHNSAFDQEAAGIYRGAVGRWSDCLDPEEVWCAQALNRSYMPAAGYEPTGVSVSQTRLFRILFSTPTALIRALKANADRRGPLLTYMVRRLAGL